MISPQGPPRSFVALLCSAIVLPYYASANMVLRQIHVVSRQGSPTTIVDGDMNYPMQTLSAVGESQMFALGEWVRSRVLTFPEEDDDTFGQHADVPEGLVERYFPTRVRFESSAFDTTIVSAQSLARGLFPVSAPTIPVFSQSERNDITIAAQNQCPALLHELDTISEDASSEWNHMEQAYMDFLKGLAQFPVFNAYATGVHGVDDPERFIPLRNVWKVYDLIREAEITCNAGYDTYNLDTCSKLTFPDAAALLDTKEWEDLKTLARFTEVRTKYGSERSSRLIAGNLLRQITERMTDDEMSTPEDVSSKRVYLTSTDYPTLVALMAALQVAPDDGQLDEAFPGYGSAILFELYQDDKTFEHMVRVLYKAAGRAIPSELRLGSFCFERDICSMLSFSQHLETVILSTDDWCQACGNDTSDLCLFYSRLTYQERLRDEKMHEELLQQNLTSDSPTKSILDLVGERACEDDVQEAFVAAFLGGIALGLVVAFIIAFIVQCIRKRQRKSKKRAATADESDMTNILKSPFTPKTTGTAGSPVTFLRRSSAKNSLANKDLEAEGLSLSDDEDEDHSSHNVMKAPESPERQNTSPASQGPSKHVFPPTIIV